MVQRYQLVLGFVPIAVVDKRYTTVLLYECVERISMGFSIEIKRVVVLLCAPSILLSSSIVTLLKL
jgi:hypothetical protein